MPMNRSTTPSISFSDDPDTKAPPEQYEEEEEIHPAPQGCGVLGRYPVASVLIFAAIGIGIGVGLSFWHPEDPATKAGTLQWIGLIGDLFIRSLKCVVLPLVFVNIIIAMLDMMSAGKASSVGWTTMGFYVVTTVMASVFALAAVLAMKGFYQQGEFGQEKSPTVSLGCSEEGYFLAQGRNGTVYCSNDFSPTDLETQFVVNDLNNSFVRTATLEPEDISLSDTIYAGVFTKLFPDNIVQSFVQGNFTAVVFFAVVFGVALSRVLDSMESKGTNTSYLVPFLKELDSVFVLIINWIVMVTPFAVLSLIAQAIGDQNDLGSAFANVGLLVVTFLIAAILQVLVVYIVIFAVVTKSNPFTFLKCLIPAQTMAFASASSAATLPMTLTSVMATGRVPETIVRFVVPLGATINMDGTALYFPCACIWLAVLNGITPNAASYILLVIISSVGSAGAAPVPAASLALIITAYNTVFNTTGTPDGFVFIIAIDWLVDRICTVLNVTGDSVVAGMVAHLSSDAKTDEKVSVELEKVIEPV